MDALMTARRQRDTYALKVYNKWYLYLLAIAVSGFVVQPAVTTFIRSTVVQAFKIPSGAMEDTLLIGDHILVNKFAYGIRIPFSKSTVHLFGLLDGPQRGDIIVFPFPRDPSRDFIKRVVGLPGDRIQVRNHRVYLNGEPIEEPYVKLDGHAALQYSRYSNWGPEVVPPGKLFVLGDNRDNSSDSRYGLGGAIQRVEFVPYGNIKGKAMIVWLSLSHHGLFWQLPLFGGTGLRTDRLFLPVR